MDEATQRIYARLTTHEFLLEVLYAQLWASTSADGAKLASEVVVEIQRTTAV